MPVNNQFTENMQAMLPQWMKMAKDPDSVGAQFLNVFGMEFEDIKQYLDSVLSNQYIDTASIEQIDITYKVPIALPIVLDMEWLDEVAVTKDGNRYFFRVVTSIRQFYADDDENKVILDSEAGIVYIRPRSGFMEGELLLKPFDTIEINGTAHYEYSLHHIWNAFDEFGLLLGVERLFGERNPAFKQRILDVFLKPGNSTKQGLVNALSRELGVATSDVSINELANKAFRGSLLNEVDGSPTTKLLNYVERVNKVFGFTWDSMAWGEAYWRSIEESQMGLEYLPHVWDAAIAGWLDTDFQSGIGDGEDLKVIAPKEESNVRNFNYSVGLRGRSNGVERIDPELDFKYKITAKGTILDEEYSPETYKYTVIASQILMLNYIIKGMKDYYVTTAIDFNVNTPGYMHEDAVSPHIEMVKGTTNLSKTSAEYKYYKIIAELETRSVADTPQLKNLTVKWTDTVGVLHDYVLDTQVDFTKNDINTVETETVNTFATPTGDVELGFGEFYNMIDTEGSFREGISISTVEITSQGSVRLILPEQ